MRTVVMSAAVAAFGVVVLFGSGAWADDTSDPNSRGDGVAPKMRVSIDPETGEFRPAPPPEEIPDGANEDPALQRARNVDDLVEEVNPAGGYTIDLKRRFGGVSKATVGATKTDPHVECEAGRKAGSAK